MGGSLSPGFPSLALPSLTDTCLSPALLAQRLLCRTLALICRLQLSLGPQAPSPPPPSTLHFWLERPCTSPTKA